MRHTHPSDVYAQELHRLGFGVPLWQPEPHQVHTNPGEFREVQIGDVGWIFEGSFHRLFNAINPEPGEAPDSHVPLEISIAGGIARNDHYLPPQVLSTRCKITCGTEAGFELNPAGISFDLEFVQDKAAFLLLRDNAARESLCGMDRKIKEYCEKNWKTWVRHAADRGLDASLIFVSGWVKTSEWALGSIIQRGTSARFRFDANFSTMTARLSPHGEIKSAPIVSQRMGPSEACRSHHRSISRYGRDHGIWDLITSEEVLKGLEEQMRDDTGLSELPKNQCVFINYYKCKERVGFLPDKISAAAGYHESRKYDDDEDVSAVEAHCDTSSGISVEQVPLATPIYDPVDFVLDYILRNSEADVAIASDMELSRICEHTLPNDIPAFLQAQRPTIDMTENGAGILSMFDDYDYQGSLIRIEPHPHTMEIVSQLVVSRMTLDGLTMKEGYTPEPQISEGSSAVTGPGQGPPCNSSGPDTMSQNKMSTNSNVLPGRRLPPKWARRHNSYVCDWNDCGTKFDQIELLLEHLRDDHLRGFHMSSGCPWKGCSAPTTFTSMHAFKCHLITDHVRAKQSQCQICGIWFSRTDSLRRHERSAHRDREQSRIEGVRHAYDSYSIREESQDNVTPIPEEWIALEETASVLCQVDDETYDTDPSVSDPQALPGHTASSSSAADLMSITHSTQIIP